MKIIPFQTKIVATTFLANFWEQFGYFKSNIRSRCVQPTHFSFSLLKGSENLSFNNLHNLNDELLNEQTADNLINVL